MLIVQIKNCYKSGLAKRSRGRKLTLIEDNEENNSSRAKQEDYVHNYTRYLNHVRTYPEEDSGVVRYETTYGQSSTGYKGRLFAKNISLQTAPRRLREIAYGALGVRDWDVESAYFTFALQAEGELKINIAHANSSWRR